MGIARFFSLISGITHPALEVGYHIKAFKVHLCFLDPSSGVLKFVHIRLRHLLLIQSRRLTKEDKEISKSVLWTFRAKEEEIKKKKKMEVKKKLQAELGWIQKESKRLATWKGFPCVYACVQRLDFTLSSCLLDEAHEASHFIPSMVVQDKLNEHGGYTLELVLAKAIRIAKEQDGEGTKTVGVISKKDQESS
ncbi:hypothetical protein STAS_06929 [Striga asiatica]|uniref:Uncharacterized protein n=1 Tax=Striga asiatica TaxID=4170 RepID=A0A5A7PDV6_STRAF|nr:hypothetical protein STAS_06929 [Striga asiatica]